MRQRTDLAVAAEDYQPHLFRVALPGTGIRKGNAYEPHHLHRWLCRHRHLNPRVSRLAVGQGARARTALGRLLGNVQNIAMPGKGTWLIFQVDPTDKTSTEDLCVARRHWRSLFGRLASL